MIVDFFPNNFVQTRAMVIKNLILMLLKTKLSIILIRFRNQILLGHLSKILLEHQKLKTHVFRVLNQFTVVRTIFHTDPKSNR